MRVRTLASNPCAGQGLFFRSEGEDRSDTLHAAMTFFVVAKRRGTCTPLCSWNECIAGEALLDEVFTARSELGTSTSSRVPEASLPSPVSCLGAMQLMSLGDTVAVAGCLRPAPHAQTQGAWHRPPESRAQQERGIFDVLGCC